MENKDKTKPISIIVDYDTYMGMVEFIKGIPENPKVIFIKQNDWDAKGMGMAIPTIISTDEKFAKEYLSDEFNALKKSYEEIISWKQQRDKEGVTEEDEKGFFRTLGNIMCKNAPKR